MNSSKSQFVKSDEKDFAELESFAKRFDAKGRTESAALLIWFLQTIYRLDDVEAEDAVCDRKFDEGFDAIFVNDSRREIAAFQCKRKKELSGTLGDVDLKTFVGSLAHLNTRQAVDHLIVTSKNTDLTKLLKSLGVAEKIEAGYVVKPIFICNIAANADADSDGPSPPLCWSSQKCRFSRLGGHSFPSPPAATLASLRDGERLPSSRLFSRRR